MWPGTSYRRFLSLLFCACLIAELGSAQSFVAPSKFSRLGRELCASASRVIGIFSRLKSGPPETKRRISVESLRMPKLGRAQVMTGLALDKADVLAQIYQMDAQGLLNDDQEFVLSVRPALVNAYIQQGNFFGASGILANLEVTGALDAEFYRYLAEQPIQWEALLNLIDQSFDPDQNSVAPQLVALDDFERIFEKALETELPSRWQSQMGDSIWLRMQKSARRLQFELNRKRWQNLFDRAQYVRDRLEFANKFIRQMRDAAPQLSASPSARALPK